MKQIIKFFMLAIPAILAVSCQSSDEIEQAGTRECKYNYVFNVAEESTRAGVSGTSVLWLTGDKLGVFAGSTVNTEGIVNAENSPVQFQFGTTEPLEANNVINCYYPYSASNASATTASVTLTIPTVQPNPNLGMPMVSLPYKVVGNEANVAGNVKFLNLAGYLKFNIACQEGTDYSSETIQSVTFTAAQPLAGSFNFNLAGVSDTDIQTLNISGYDEAAVTALASGNESIGDGKSVYMAVAPGEYSGTITVITDAAKYTFTIPDENKLAVVRAHIKSVKATLKETNRIEGATVALVNNQGYATLADAVTAANNSTKDCTITLVKDATVDKQYTFNNANGRKITFDLNGHTMTDGSVTNPLFTVKTSMEFTDNSAEGNGEFVSDIDQKQLIYVKPDTGNPIEFAISGGTYNSACSYQNTPYKLGVIRLDAGSAGDLTATFTGNTVINNTRATGTYRYAVNCLGYTDLTIESGSYGSSTCNNSILISATSTITINGGKFYKAFIITSGGIVNCYGGYYATSVTPAEGYACNPYSDAEDTALKYIVEPIHYVAQVDDEPFTSLTAAVARVNELTTNCTLTLLEDCTAPKDGITLKDKNGRKVTFNLNDHVLTGNPNDASSYTKAVVIALCNVEFTSLTSAGTISSSVNSAIRFEPEASGYTAEFKGGTYTSSSSITVRGGGPKISSSSTPPAASIVVYPGTVISNTGTYGALNIGGTGTYKAGAWTIYGGEFTAAGANAITLYGKYSTLDIKGGVFSSAGSTPLVFSKTNDPASVLIEGGYFNADICSNTLANTKIAGGYFAVKPTQTYLHVGCECVSSGREDYPWLVR